LPPILAPFVSSSEESSSSLIFANRGGSGTELVDLPRPSDGQRRMFEVSLRESQNETGSAAEPEET